MISDKHLIVFDTNALFKPYKGKVNYADFSFNNKFYEVVSAIEKVDAIDYISIGIPEVVLHELKLQLYASYQENIKQLKELCSCSFHFGTIEIPKFELPYKEYLERLMDDKAFLRRENVNIVVLPLPSANTHESLIMRALNKHPPFEGKEKQSDKGYKDALIWESIIEYKQKYPEWNILLTTEDSRFNGYLGKEYTARFPGEEIKILKYRDAGTSHDILTEINNIALLINPSTFVPQSSIESDLEQWLLGPYFCEEISLIADLLFEEIVSSEVRFSNILCERVFSIEVFDENGDTHARITSICTAEFDVVKTPKFSLRGELFLQINVIDLKESVIDIEDYSFDVIDSKELI